MPYFRNKEINLLFIHIPKTGGTSLEAYFSEKFNIPLDKHSLFCSTINENIFADKGIKVNSSP